MKVLGCFLIVFQITSYSQELSLRLVKVIDSNLFELSTGDRIRLVGIVSPSSSVSDERLRAVASEAIDYARRTLVGKPIKITWVPDTTSLYPLAYISRVYASLDMDITRRFLERGYGVLASDQVEQPEQHEYSAAEQAARNSRDGVWSILLADLERPSVDSVASDWSKAADDFNIKSAGPRPRTIQSKNGIVTNAELLSQAPVEYTTKLTPQILLSVGCLIITVDLLGDASDLQDGIDSIRRDQGQQEQLAELESRQTRKYVLAGACVALGIVNAFFSFEKVQIQSNGKSLTVGYNF